MDAIVDGKEDYVNPTPEWIRQALAMTPDYEDRFVCLMRDPDDQMNALYVDDAFVLEWYSASEGGHLAGFRKGEAPAIMPKRLGLIARLFGSKSPLHGSRISLDEAATVLDSYVSGAKYFEGIEWKRIP